MDLKQVRSFVEVARVKRFTEAAERLHLSQPAVSAQIRALEKDLGAELLERTTKRVRLTEKGRQFYTYAVRIMELERTAREKMASPGGHVITLGASTIPSSCLLPPVLASYRRERPDCFFRVLQSDSQAAVGLVLDGTVDFAVVGDTPEDPALAVRELCRDRLLIVTPVSEHYMGLKHHGAALEQLLEEPVILRENGSGTRKYFDRFLERHGIRREDLNVAACANDLEAVRRMVAGGMGISMMSAFAVQDLIRSGQIIAYQTEEEISRRFCLVWRKKHTLTEDERRFADYLKKHVPQPESDRMERHAASAAPSETQGRREPYDSGSAS